MSEVLICPYCEFSKLKELARNSYNTQYECPLCGKMTSTEIGDILARRRKHEVQGDE